MNKNWLVIWYSSKLTMPEIKGLAETNIKSDTIPPPLLVGSTLVLKITDTYCLKDLYTGKEHDIFKCESNYEIPVEEIKDKQDLFDVYFDAEKNMFTQLNLIESSNKIPLTTIPDPAPKETYQAQVDWIYHTLLKR